MPKAPDTANHIPVRMCQRRTIDRKMTAGHRKLVCSAYIVSRQIVATTAIGIAPRAGTRPCGAERRHLWS